MAIQLDTTPKFGSLEASKFGGQDIQTSNPLNLKSSLLGGSSVTVTSGAMTDLEALVAKLRNESERAKFSMLLTSLSSIGQSLTDVQKRNLEKGLALSEQLKTLNESLKDLSLEADSEKAKALVLQQKIDQLTNQIEQAVKDGKEHNELVAEQKRVREELDAKQKVIDETQGKIDQAKNEISSVRGQISAIISSIGENELKTIASELSTLADPEKAERPAEAAKEAEKEAENDPFAAIRESLAEIERDITETIAENRIETV